jgi:hypothetical protein
MLWISTALTLTLGNINKTPSTSFAAPIKFGLFLVDIQTAGQKQI